jgi:hypothetical protein
VGVSVAACGADGVEHLGGDVDGEDLSRGADGVAKSGKGPAGPAADVGGGASPGMLASATAAS